MGIILVPEKGKLRGRGIVASLNGNAVADEPCCSPVLLARRVDKSIGEKPERAIAAQRDGIRIVGSDPTRILPKELIGLRPSRGEVIGFLMRAARQAEQKKGADQDFTHLKLSY